MQSWENKVKSNLFKGHLNPQAASQDTSLWEEHDRMLLISRNWKKKDILLYEGEVETNVPVGIYSLGEHPSKNILVRTNKICLDG